MNTFLPDTETIVDGFLRRQRTLSAVDLFTAQHEPGDVPAHARHYRDLIPSRRPGRGEQFSFEVDLDSCSGCKACVTACHSLNGLDEGEAWRDVGLLVGRHASDALQQSVTTGCHHCVDPACLNGCPVLAYEKDPVTGIVRHLDDQCIGCQYCILKCPYEVPQYSKSRGIVRKCDMCSGRLEAGEAPACVQACPNRAIAIRVVSQQAGRARAAEGIFLPDAPDPTITIPTTVYRGRPVNRNDLVGGDHARREIAPSHWPLAVMLVLTQLATGLFFVSATISFFPSPPELLIGLIRVIGLITLFLGLGCSVMHLGRPSQAWRSWLGWRRSWLSREVIAFGLFAFCATLQTAARPSFEWLAAGTTCALGVFAVFCSAMVYHDTHRRFWAISDTGKRFALSTVFLGFAGSAGLAAFAGNASIALILASVAVAAGGGKLLWEATMICGAQEHAELLHSIMLMKTLLWGWTILRFFLGTTGLLLLAVGGAMRQQGLPILVGAGFCFLGELVERILFFRAASPARMPGNP